MSANLVTFSDLQDVVTLKRDQPAIRNASVHLKVTIPSSVNDNVNRLVQQRLGPFPIQHRHDYGESDDESPECFIILTIFTKAARELPQPYIFMYARAFLAEGGKGKVRPFHFTIEFFAGGLSFPRRLAVSFKILSVIAENLDYLSFLAKRRDYPSQAVLECDLDFRRRALNEKCDLNISHSRAVTADIHLHAGTIMRHGNGRNARFVETAPYGSPRVGFGAN